jgi:cytochrome P450
MRLVTRSPMLAWLYHRWDGTAATQQHARRRPRSDRKGNSPMKLASVPAAPGRLPLLGHTIAILRRPQAFLTALSSVGEMVRVDIGAWPIYFLTSPDNIHEVLVEQGRNFTRGRFFDRIQPLLGDSLITSEGAMHRRQRRLMQPAFHYARVSGYVERMQCRAQNLTDSWDNGEIIAFDRAMYDTALAIVIDTMFAMDVRPAIAAEIHRSLPVIVRDIVPRAVLPQRLDPLLLPVNRRFDAAAARLRNVVDSVIDEYRTNETCADSLLSILMSAHDADTGEMMTAKELRDELITVMTAGTETTAMTLAWLFDEFTRHPDIQERVHAEVAAVIGRRPITAKDISELTYLDAVLKETTRLHTPLLFMRRSIGSVRIGGVDLPPGTEVAHSPYALHRNPALYAQADQFRPERWLDTANPIPRGAYIPFGNGARKCIGDAFAWTELVVVTATITQRWRIDQVPGHRTREVRAGMPRPHALPVIVTRRS